MAAVVEFVYDWDGIKTRPENRVDVVMTQLLGAPQQTKADWLSWRCPFHDDRVASLKVSLTTNRWKCFGGCFDGRFHDVYDLIQAVDGVDRTEAYYRLSGERPEWRENLKSIDLSAIPKVPEEIKKDGITLDEVKAVAGTPEALAYFNGRGITEETVREYYLGDQWKSHPIVTTDADNPIFWTKRHHYTIPYFRPDGSISTVKCRRDDAFHKQDILKLPDRVFGQVLEYLDKTLDGKTPTDDELLDIIYGGKFTHWSGRGAGPSIFNERLLRKIMPDGTEVRPWLPYVLIVEAEIDVLYLRDAKGIWGYPAVATKNPLPDLFKRTGKIFIIQDNDPDRVDPKTGKIENAGRNIAETTQRKLGRGDILHPPQFSANGTPVKDVNDLPAAELESWLRSVGVYPQPRALL